MIMNDAMFVDREELNEFTSELKDRCRKAENGTILVKLRNGNWREVKYLAEDKEDDRDPMFMSGDWDFLWRLDGSSVTNDDLDLVEMAS